jgi:putative FmdB family regulatory protein
MPVYEFACNACGAPLSVFVRSMSSSVSGECARCGSKDLRRLVSKFAFTRSSGGSDDFDESMLDELGGVDDPRAMAHWARKMQDQMGDDLGPEFDSMIGQMERGEPPSGFDGGMDDGDFDDV